MSTANDTKLDELYQLRYDLSLDLYKQKARAREVEALSSKGNPVEYLAYKIFGYRLIGSLAFALDPYWQFADKSSLYAKNSLFKTVFPLDVVPANRTRRFPTIGSFANFHSDEKAHSRNSANTVDWNGTSWVLAPTKVTLDSTSDLSGTFPGQVVIFGFVKDTTDATRRHRSPFARQGSQPFQSAKTGEKGKSRSLATSKTKKVKTQGELEMYIPTIRSFSGGYNWQEKTVIHQQSAVAPQFWTRSDLYTEHYGGFITPCASVTKSNVDNYAVTEKNNALAAFAKNKDSMLEHCVPSRRYFNLAYQIAELKDLPQALKGTLTLWFAVERQFGKQWFQKALLSAEFWTLERRKQFSQYANRLNIPMALDQQAADAFLNFKFGWQSMVQAIAGLVAKPGVIANEINNLIARQGKATSFSVVREYDEIPTSTPAITIWKYARTNIPAGIPQSSSAIRHVRLRMVVNADINFPHADIPKLRHDLWARKLGTNLTPGDLLDLVPWTWLFDWFFGAGNYLHLLDAVNGDKSLINYGFLTYRSITEVTSQLVTFGNATDHTLVIPPNGQPTETTTRWFNQGAVFTSKYQLRLSLGTIAGMKTYSGKGGLNPTQIGILGALLAKYLK